MYSICAGSRVMQRCPFGRIAVIGTGQYETETFTLISASLTSNPHRANTLLRLHSWPRALCKVCGDAAVISNCLTYLSLNVLQPPLYRPDPSNVASHAGPINTSLTARDFHADAKCFRRSPATCRRFSATQKPNHYISNLFFQR